MLEKLNEYGGFLVFGFARSDWESAAPLRLSCTGSHLESMRYDAPRICASRFPGELAGSGGLSRCSGGRGRHGRVLIVAVTMALLWSVTAAVRDPGSEEVFTLGDGHAVPDGGVLVGERRVAANPRDRRVGVPAFGERRLGSAAARASGFGDADAGGCGAHPGQGSGCARQAGSVAILTPSLPHCPGRDSRPGLFLVRSAVGARLRAWPLPPPIGPARPSGPRSGAEWLSVLVTSLSLTRYGCRAGLAGSRPEPRFCDTPETTPNKGLIQKNSLSLRQKVLRIRQKGLLREPLAKLLGLAAWRSHQFSW